MTGAVIRTFQADDPLRDVFVAGVDDDEELFHLAARFGTVLYARIMRESQTGRSRGFGFVRYATPEDARKGIAALNGLAVRSRVLRASPLRPALYAPAFRAKEKRSS
jgi:RNA recognition motif-containing protein